MSVHPSAQAAGGRPVPGGTLPHPGSDNPPEVPPGWHVLHLFYRLDRAVLDGYDERRRHLCRDAFIAIVDGMKGPLIEQAQAFAVIGHKADCGLILAGPDLAALHAVQVDLAASPAGPALHLCDSFYSVTEISEYVPDEEQYARILRDREGMDPASSIYQTRLKQYASRLEGMNRQRLYPVFPDWPCLCFYPMNKARKPGQNWYLEPFSARYEMMAEHGKSGMKFAGRVTQVITASTGLDDWEWGVTLWSPHPAHLKDIVYTMRFDQASAQYAEFGTFYVGNVQGASSLAQTMRL